MDVTYNATVKLKKKFDFGKNPMSGIRISVLSGSYIPAPQFTFAEKANEGDKIVTIDGLNLFIDKSTEEILSGYIIDFNSNGFKLDYMLPKGRCCR